MPKPKSGNSRAGAAFCLAALLLASCGQNAAPPGPTDPGGGAGNVVGAPQAEPPTASPTPGANPSTAPSPAPSPTPSFHPLGQPDIPYPYPTPSIPPVGPGEAVGQVLYGGAPIAGIPITVTSNLTWHTYNLTTDANGVFRVSNLPAGDYFAEYYNDSHNDKIGFWKTLIKHVDSSTGVFYPAFDVEEVGMKNTPPEGGSAALPFDFQWHPPQPIIKAYRFRIHDSGGPGGKPYYISDLLPASASDYVYDGTVNQAGMPSVNGKLAPGHYLWGVWWDAGPLGEGGNLYQDFTVSSD